MTEIIRLSETALEKAVNIAAKVLLNGGVVAVPTDTVYGLVCTLNNFDKLYKVKKRGPLKPIGILVSDIEEIKKWCIPCSDDYVLQRLLPGPVTLLFPRLPTLPHDFNAGHKVVGIRIPRNEFINKLTRKFCVQPLVQTSANISGQASAGRIEDFRELWSEIDLIVDGGKILDADGKISRSGSTVVNLCGSGTYSVIRDGSARVATEFILRDCGLVGTTDGDYPSPVINHV